MTDSELLFIQQGEVINQEPKKRIILLGFFLVGVSAFFFLLFPMTDPALYKNDIYVW
jgi:hypothetical protein